MSRPPEIQPMRAVDDVGQKEKKGDLWATLLLTFLCLFTAILLSEAYRGAQRLGMGAWQGAFAIHALASVGILGLFLGKKTLGRNFSVWGANPSAPRWFKVRPWTAYLPALVLSGGSFVLAMSSHLMGGGGYTQKPTSPMAWILCVPFVEEIFFRGGIGAWYRRLMPGIAAGWLASATFALAHSGLTLSHIAQGQVGLPLGPFLLGLLCEILYILSGSLVPPIAVHVAANATVTIFQVLDVRWLEWLSLFYI